MMISCSGSSRATERRLATTTEGAPATSRELNAREAGTPQPRACRRRPAQCLGERRLVLPVLGVDQIVSFAGSPPAGLLKGRDQPSGTRAGARPVRARRAPGPIRWRPPQTSPGRCRTSGRGAGDSRRVRCLPATSATGRATARSRVGVVLSNAAAEASFPARSRPGATTGTPAPRTALGQKAGPASGAEADGGVEALVDQVDQLGRGLDLDIDVGRADLNAARRSSGRRPWFAAPRAAAPPRAGAAGWRRSRAR